MSGRKLLPPVTLFYIKAFISKQKIRNRRRLAIVSDYLLLVEMAVFETASENSFSQLSTSVADKLNLSLNTPVGRLISGQLRYAWRVTETLARSRSLLIDALSRSAVLPGKTAAIKQLLKQFYCCRLFLINLRFLKRYRTSARLPGFKIPVEILSSPYMECTMQNA